jgi:hypothetical protein
VYHSPVLAIRFGTSGVVEPDSPLVTQNFAASPFSSAKTRGNPQIRVESQANDLSFVLPETSPDAFALLVKWLYQGSLTAVSSLPSEEQWPYAFLCQQVYSLASSFRMPDLQNEAIDQFRLGCHTADLVPGADEIVMVYKSTEPGSELRKLVSKVAARQIMDPDDECSAASYRDCFADPDFSADLVDAIRKGVGGVLLDDPNEESGCVYHVHEPGSSCSSRGKGRRLMSGNGILKYGSSPLGIYDSDDIAERRSLFRNEGTGNTTYKHRRTRQSCCP